MARRNLCCLFLLALVASACRKSTVDEAGATRLAEDFVAAWAARDWAKAYGMLHRSNRDRLTEQQFARGMLEHPSVRGVESVTITEPDDKYPTGELKAATGSVQVRIHLLCYSERCEVFTVETWPDRYPLLPPIWPELARAHAYLSAMVARDWPAAFAQTHPVYRSQVSKQAYTDALSQNVWLREAIGFHLRHGKGKPGAALAEGVLLGAGGSRVDASVQMGEHGGHPWVTETVLGGTPTLPKPDAVKVKVEKGP